MSSYKLNYFNVRGRAEVSRILFFLNDVEFIDNRIPFNEWPKHKDSFVFKQMPVLEVDGIQIAQSDAIAKYLAKKFNLVGSNDIEEAQIDAVASQTTDAQNKLAILYFSQDETAKENARKEVLPMFSCLENFLKNNKHNSGFLVGNKMSWADIKLWDILCLLEHWVPDALKECPSLCALREKIGNLPKIKEWVAARGKPDMENI